MGDGGCRMWPGWCMRLRRELSPFLVARADRELIFAFCRPVGVAAGWRGNSSVPQRSSGIDTCGGGGAGCPLGRNFAVQRTRDRTYSTSPDYKSRADSPTASWAGDLVQSKDDERVVGQDGLYVHMHVGWNGHHGGHCILGVLFSPHQGTSDSLLAVELAWGKTLAEDGAVVVMKSG